MQIEILIKIAGLGLLWLTGAGEHALFFAGVSLVGLCFGALMGIYPGFTADQFGPAHNSVNYGIMFIGFALAGLLGPMLMNTVVSATGRYQPAFIACAVLAAVGEVLINLFTRTAEKG
jgi:MFS family permease